MVRGQGQHVNAHLLHVERHVADSLYRIGVEDRTVCVCDRDCLEVLDGADLVVCRHDGDKSGLVGDDRLQLLEVDVTLCVNVQIGDRIAFLRVPHRCRGLRGVRSWK